MSQTKSWTLFQEHLSSTADDKESNDVTFAFGNDEFMVKANRGLLSLMSPVFKSMFSNGMKESLHQSNIQIKDTDIKSFKLFIQYFYGKDPEITPSNIGALSYLAEKYLVSGLQKICAMFLTEFISIDNLIHILESLHKHHQTKLFENCKIWMTKQTSIDATVNMFKSDAFMNTQNVIVNVLLSGFGEVIDPSALWQCVVKWSKTTKHEVIMKDICNDECKDDEKNEQDTKQNQNLVSIRGNFPFHRLPIEIVCSDVLPMNVLTKEMAFEVLTHKCSGLYRELAQYCIPHQKLNFPKAEKSTNINFEFEKNKDKFKVATRAPFPNQHTVVYADSPGIIFGNIGMKSTDKYTWEIYMNKKEDNTSDYFGIDAIENNSAPGNASQNSWGMNVDQNRACFYGNSKNVGCDNNFKSKKGTVFRMEFDGPRKQLRIYADGQQSYSFNGVQSLKPLYPSFYIGTAKTSFTVRNFQTM